MIDVFLVTQIIASNPEIQKFCADAVGIPYASDNFTDEEWQLFQQCVTFFEDRQTLPEAPATPLKPTGWV